MVAQTCAYIRARGASGAWGEGPPAVRVIAEQFGVAPNTVMAALRRLEREGVLVGTGRERRFAPGAEGAKRRGGAGLRVGVLSEKPAGGHTWRTAEWLGALRAFLEKAGHTVVWVELPAAKLERPQVHVAPRVREAGAQAWIVAGGLRDTLDWFLDEGVPALNYGGHATRRPMSVVAVNAYEAMREALGHLTGLGHRRVVFLTPGAWRKPQPGRMVEIFGEALAGVGVAAGAFHVPDWEETPEGLEALLKELFRYTPPTAVLCVDPEHLLGVMSFLTAQGLRVPGDVSLVCLTDHPALRWMRPRPACFLDDDERLLRNVKAWLADVARGRREPKDSSVVARFEAHEGVVRAPHA